MDLRDKTVFITGASIGIGRALALAFARESAQLVLTHRSSKREMDDVVAECKKFGAREVMSYKLDVTEDENIKEVIRALMNEWKGIDVLVNNAGVIVRKELEDQSFEDVEKQVRTNLEGLIKVTRACSPHLTDAVVNIASVMGLSGMGGAPVYTATKWGVRGFSKALAAERSDLRVFPVNPGATKTQMTGFAGVPPEQVADIVVRLVKGELDVASGDDVTISDYL